MKLKVGFCVFVLLLTGIVNAIAQETVPCDNVDPDTPCPLDTWVIVLAVIASGLAAYGLYRRQNMLQHTK